MGQFLGCAGVDGRPSAVLPMKIVSQCREQARRAYYGAVFEAKKEIPDETNKNVALSIRTPYALPGLLRRVPVRPDFVRPDYAATPALDPRSRRPTICRRRQLRPGYRSGGGARTFLHGPDKATSSPGGNLSPESEGRQRPGRSRPHRRRVLPGPIGYERGHR